MKTTSFMIEDLRVPCNSHCRYCLLACENRINTTGFKETETFIRRLDEEFRNSDIHFSYYMGYCMDTSDLHDYIKMCQKLGYPSADFLQLNGLKFRDLGAIANFITVLRPLPRGLHPQIRRQGRLAVLPRVHPAEPLAGTAPG